MKDWIVKQFKAVVDKVKAFMQPKLDKAKGPVKFLLITLMAVGVVVGVLALFAALIGFLFVLPGMVYGLAFWGAWTYFGLGATYFPTLDPLYLNIPYWHFVGLSTILVFAFKLIRPKKRLNTEPAKTVNNVFGK